MKRVQFRAVILTALALVPSAAHVLELPEKLAMEQGAYLTTQTIYRGWAWLGALLAAAFVAILALVFEARHQTNGFTFAVGAAFSLAASFVIFFVWTYPVNRVTKNWKVAPEHSQALLTQWEYSHAANAAVLLMALCLTVLAVLSLRSQADR